MGTLVHDGEITAATHVMLGNTITFYDDAFNSSAGEAIMTTLHEFGHAFDRHGLSRKSNTFEDTFWDNCLGFAGECMFADVTGAKFNGTLVDPNNSYNPAEDFASSFAPAVCQKSGLQIDGVVAPAGIYFSADRINYMSNLIDDE